MTPDALRPSDWTLDPRIERDAAFVTDLPLSRVLLMREARYPWLILVPRRPGAIELLDLEAADRASLLEETMRASEALRRLTSCDKLNVATLGNVVSQLHLHVIARFRTDEAWPGPVWGVHPPRPYESEEEAAWAARVRRALGEGTGP